MKADRQMTFLQWCRLQSSRADSVGDFARDWSADTDRPRAPSCEAMEDYLEGLGASEAAIAAGRRAYTEWELAVVADPAPSPGYDRDLLAAKIKWEGGIVSTLEYGLRSEDIADPDLRVQWQAMEHLWDEMRLLVDEFQRSLRR